MFLEETILRASCLLWQLVFYFLPTVNKLIHISTFLFCINLSTFTYSKEAKASENRY